mmetsp:Transcript_87949/g.247096  ORF Transcript_87949/g.247096 Transcript_87949/m.247096 type:complete len:469 (+) Transcript_87949:29-1435(+)
MPEHGPENNGASVVSDPDRPQLGLFLRATRDFAKGELLVREAPLLHVPRGVSLKDLGAAAAELRAANLFVPDAGSPVLRQLRQQARTQCEDGFFLKTVLHFNSFAAGVSGRDQSVFATLARANHSCAPNCVVDGDDGTLRAIRDVQKGEALTVSYIDEATLLWPRERRQAELRKRWDFLCDCARCSAPADDVRRFRKCHVCDCGGDLLVDHVGAVGEVSALRCVRCRVTLGATESRALLAAEASAMAALKRALSGDLEEEDEGQELIRCYKFASQHPTHTTALELADAFAFPDPVVAKRTILEGLRVVLGDVPNQLAVECGRELAELLAANGDRDVARTVLESAAAMAAILDGGNGAIEVLQVWERRPRARLFPTTAPAAKVDDVASHIDVGEPKPLAATSTAVGGCSGHCACAESGSGAILAENVAKADAAPPSHRTRHAEARNAAVLAVSSVSVALLAVVLLRWRR